MKKSYLLAIFLILAAAQLYVPLAQAWQWENVLKTGQPFYLETTPIDPYDALRGRYIALNFKENKAPVDQNLIGSLKNGQPLYAILAQKDNGTAFIKEISAVKPVAEPYVNVKFSGTSAKMQARVTFPFKRYYLPEEAAPQAEKALSRRNKKKKSALALVYVKDGYGVIENIYVDEKPLLQYLREQKDS